MAFEKIRERVNRIIVFPAEPHRKRMIALKKKT